MQGIIATAAKKIGHAVWVKETDAQTDMFWQAAYDIATRDFPDLEMKSPKFARGQTWIIFRPHEMPTLPRVVAVNLKADRGLADLTFSGILCRLFNPLVSPFLDDDMTTHQAGKSTVIRLAVPPFGISDFDPNAEEYVRAAFAACTRLIRFYRQHRLALDLAASHSLPEPLAPDFIHLAEKAE